MPTTTPLITPGQTPNPEDYIEVNARHVACDGGKGALGHPKVYLEIGPTERQVMCPYCSRTFVLDDTV